MAGGKPNPPRPPQEDVEKHPTSSINPLISEQNVYFNNIRREFSTATLVGGAPTPLPTLHRDETPQKYQNLVFGSFQHQAPILQQNHIFYHSQASSHKNRSYADIVTGRVSTNNQKKIHCPGSRTESGNNGICLGRIALKPSTTYLGKPAIIFSNSEKHSMLQGMKYMLIAKFSHGRPSLACVKDVFNTFNLKDNCNISIYDTKHLILEFEAFDDYVHVWMQQQLVVRGFVMRLFKWREDFQPIFESPICPVWVHLPGLPLHLYQEQVLMSIANVIGRPLALDLDNIKRNKLGCASFCVEVDVSVEVIDKIWIEFEAKGSSVGRKGIWQTVFYDRLPPYCIRCAHLGHSLEHCLREKSIEESSENSEFVDQAKSVVSGASSIGNEVKGAAAEHLLTVPVQKAFCNLNLGLSGIGSDSKGQEVEKELVAGHSGTLQKSVTVRDLMVGADNARERTSDVLDLGAAKAISDVQEMQKTLGAAEGLGTDYNKAGVQELQVVLGAADGLGTDCNKAGAHQGLSPAETAAGELARVPTAGYKELTAGETAAQEVAAWEAYEDAVLVEDLTLEEGEIAAEKQVQAQGTAADAVYMGDLGDADARTDTLKATHVEPHGTAAISLIAAAAAHQENCGAEAVSIGEHVKAAAVEADHLLSRLVQQVTEITPTVQGVQDAQEDGNVKGNFQLKGMLANKFIGAVTNEVDSSQLFETLLQNNTTVSGQILMMPLAGGSTADGEHKHHVSVGTALVSWPAAGKSGATNGAAMLGNTEEVAEAYEDAILVKDLILDEGETAIENTVLLHSQGQTLSHKSSISPRKLSSTAAEFKPKWEVLVKELVEDNKQSHPVMVDRSHKKKKASAGNIVADRVQNVIAKAQAVLAEKKAQAQGDHTTLHNNAMEQLQERMNRLRGIEVPAAQRLAASTRVPTPLLPDEMKDIICPFKCKSVPNSPPRSKKQSKSLFDSPAYSQATHDFLKRYGSDTSDDTSVDFDCSWQDYDC